MGGTGKVAWTLAALCAILAAIAVGQISNSSGVTQVQCSCAAPEPATTAPVGGGLLAVGGCTSTVTAVAEAVTSEAVLTTPSAFPGIGSYWYSYVSAAGQVTTNLCAVVALTPPSVTFNLRVLQ
jgi:hypothetical protein